MFHRTEANWIGFQETQKAICNLKEEIEIAEKRIHNAKRSFIKQTTQRKNYSIQPEGQLTKAQFPKSKESNNQYSSKEKIVPYEVTLLRDEKTTIPKKIFSASEEEPDIPPSRFPHIELIDLKKTLISSFDNLLSSTEDSASVGDVKHSSSERTSSLIASTYREANKLFKKHEAKEKVITTNLCKSFTTETSDQENDYKENKVFKAKKSLHNGGGDIGMEWTDVSKNKAFFLQNKFKTDNINKLKDIIDRQKKRQELYQLQLEQDALGSLESLNYDHMHSDVVHRPKQMIKDDHVLPIPVRKIRTVKSLPNYKGFSAPPKNLPTNKRWRKQRNKHTIASSSNFKAYGINPAKRIKIVKSESNLVSHIHNEDANKLTTVANDDDSFSKGVDSVPSETVKNSMQEDEIPDEKKDDNDKPFQKTVNLKTDIQTILNSNQLSDDNSLNDVKDTTFSHDVPVQLVSSVGDNNQNTAKKDEKPIKFKSIKKKTALQESNVTSPKVRHYDPAKVREYIRKKKEERKKKDLEEKHKKILEAQKKKEHLEKLIEYQKQNVKAVAKVKPFSPTKTGPKGNSIVREQEHIQENTTPRNEYIVQSYMILDGKDNLEKEKAVSWDNDSKKKLLEAAQKENDSVKNQVNINNSQKRKRDNMHIDISMPKFISTSVAPSLVHQTSSKNVKDNFISSDGSDLVKSVKAAAKSELIIKSPKESSVQETAIKTVECEDTKDISMDIHDSQVFKNVSSVSTPSGISQLSGIDPKLIEQIKSCEDPFSGTKQRKNGELKKLVESINVITEPLEPFLYTKQWLIKNPMPPKTLKPRIPETVKSSKEHEFHHSARNPDIQLNTFQPKSSKEASFKEQISGIGDISQLYAQILSKKSINEEMTVVNKQSSINKSNHQQKAYQYLSNEDKIIEGSIKSEAEYVSEQLGLQDLESHVETSNHSSHFSDLQKENTIPDPFNFINTCKKKPLGFTIHSKNIKSEGVSSKLSNSNVPFEEMYKSVLNTSSEATKSSENVIRESSQDFSHNKEEEISSCMSDNQNENFTSKANSPNGISSNISYSSKTSSKSVTSSQRLSRKSQKDVSNKSKSHQSETTKKDPNVNKSSEISPHKQAASDTIAKKEMFETNDTIPDINSSNISEMVLSGTIYSEYTLESEKSSPVPVSNVPSSNASDVVLSGTITSEYTLEMDGENSDKDDVKVTKERSNEKASASESSISEVISVVENSKGFRSSVEDLLSNQSISHKDNENSANSFANDKSINNDKDSEKHASEGSAELHSAVPSTSGQQNIPFESSKPLKDDIELTSFSQKIDQFHGVPPASQNSITIDFRQPLRLTLSNGESVQTNQGLNAHESQYLHTQLVTRVASEAAAAAATSAVLAVFETQKALLSEKNHLGILNAYGRSNSSKKTQYSSDFESSADAKSSSPSPHSSAVDSKQSDSIAEDPPVSNNDEVSPRSDSVEEQILSTHSNPDQVIQSKSSHNSSIKKERNEPSLNSELSENASQKLSEGSRRKISSNISSPSPASLSENGSVTTETSISSHSNLSHQSESALSDDSFAQLTLDVVHKMTQEEELRASHQLAFLQFQEKVLVQKARAEMAWLESLKKKLKQKGSEKKVSTIKRRQKEIILRLRQERAQLQCMQEAYRSICEKHHSLLKDKKKLLKEPSLLAFELLTKDEKPGTSKYAEQKLKEFYTQKSSSSTPSVVSENDEKTMIGEDSTSEVPEMLKGLGSNSSQESVIETQPSEFTKTSGSPQNKSQRSSPNPPVSPLNAVPSNSNPSIHSSNSLESVLQGLKKLEASKRHLTKREQRILQRRKKVEHLLQWQKKLDNEEMAVRELEKKALDIVDHSRKKTKYYVSSSGSTQDDDKRREMNYETLSPTSEIRNHITEQPEKSPAEYAEQSENNAVKMSDESIHTTFSANELDIHSDGDKGNVPDSDAAHSSGFLPEEIKPESGESSIQTVEITENGSQAEEVASEEMSNHISSIKDKSSGSDVYSESFESTASKKSPSVLSISPPFKNSSPSKNFKKDYGPGIRLPLVPRNLRRHDSSGSDDSYTISQSETASDQSDIEVRIHALSEELKRRKAEAEKLKREQKKKNRERLKEKELSLQKQLEAYNQYIHQAKLELDQQIESAVTPQTSDVVKPRIKWPRPEKVVGSRRVRKQASLSSDAFGLEKKIETVNNTLEISENCEVAAAREKDATVKKLFSGPSAKTDEENIKDTSERSTDNSKELSDVSSINSSSKNQEISEILPANSISSEIPSEINENVSLSSNKSHDFSDIKSSESNQKNSTVVSSVHEIKSSIDKSDSKSQTDTFNSESVSSKISDLSNSQQVEEENIVFNKTVSSDSELSSQKATEVSKDLSEKSNMQQSSNTSHEIHSSEDSVSEIPSVNNSVSLEEELDCESSNKNSKCNSSEGCETHFIKEVIDKVDEQEKPLDVLSKENEIVVSNAVSVSISQVKIEKKNIPSESEVLNIVNYLSTSLINDAVHNLFEISNKRNILKSFLNQKSHENKLQVASQNIKKKTAEILVHSLLDLHLKDAFISLFKILKSRRTKSQKSVFSNFPNMTDNIQTIAPVSFISTLNSNMTMAIIEETNEFPLNQSSCDINSNQIFAEPVNLNVNYLAVSENEQQLQQQQLLLQQYSYFYRKIPNKPPPPYTPPSSTALSSEFPFVKEKQAEKIMSVKKVTKHINEVVDYALDVILDGKSKGLALADISLSKDSENFVKLELSTPPQSVFVDFVFDLIKEIILEKFSETEQIPQPWLRPRKLTPKPPIPSSKEAIKKNIFKDLEKALKINEETKNVNKRKQITWSSLKLGRKKRDFVDTILISELKEEEPDWVNYDQDEVTVKLQIADSIFNVLINDTVCTIKNLQQKLQL